MGEFRVLMEREVSPGRHMDFSYCREVFGARPWHNQTYQGADCTQGLRLPTPSQFDILNNYWICHQTKLSDTKSCVNLWLLPPKLCMTQWIIHEEEVEEEEDDGQIRKEKKKKTGKRVENKTMGSQME